MQGNLLVPFLEGLEAAMPPGYSAGIWTKSHLIMATRQMPTLPQQHQASIPRKGQRNGGARKVLLTCVEGSVHGYGDHAHREETCRRSHADLDLWKGGVSQRLVAAIFWGIGLEHGFH